MRGIGSLPGAYTFKKQPMDTLSLVFFIVNILFALLNADADNRTVALLNTFSAGVLLGQALSPQL